MAGRGLFFGKSSCSTLCHAGLGRTPETRHSVFVVTAWCLEYKTTRPVLVCRLGLVGLSEQN